MDEYGPLPDWIKIRSNYNKEAYNKLSKYFGPGESSCIALAQEEDNPILLIDDRRAKKVAQDIGIQCIGSLGVLLIAKRENVIENVSLILDKIKETDFRVTDSIIRTIIRLAGE